MSSMPNTKRDRGSRYISPFDKFAGLVRNWYKWQRTKKHPRYRKQADRLTAQKVMIWRKEQLLKPKARLEARREAAKTRHEVITKKRLGAKQGLVKPEFVS